MKKTTAKNNLHNLEIVELAMAGTPAVPGAGFAVMKSLTLTGGQTHIIKTVPFVKNEAKKQVFGYVLVPDVADLQGDVVTKEEIEKAMHSFMKAGFYGDAKVTGVSGNHVTFDGVSHPIECCIDIDGSHGEASGLAKGEGVAGAWWVGVQLGDGEWDLVQKGDYTGFSIGGSGGRTPVDGEPDVAKSTLNKALDWLASKVKKADGDALSFNDVQFYDAVWSELYTKLEQLQYSITTIAFDGDVTDKLQAISATIDEFKAALLGALTVQKAGKEISAANQAILEEVVQVAGKLQTILERMQPADADSTAKALTQGDDMANETLEKVQAALEALNKRLDDEVLPKLDTLEKAKAKADPDDVKKDDAKPDGDKKNDAKTDSDATADGITKALEPLTKKLDDIVERLEKVEDEPGKQAGGDKDGHDGSDYDRNDPEAVKKNLGGKILGIIPVGGA